jgi:hypothetical protein
MCIAWAVARSSPNIGDPGVDDDADQHGGACRRPWPNQSGSSMRGRARDSTTGAGVLGTWVRRREPMAAALAATLWSGRGLRVTASCALAGERRRTTEGMETRGSRALLLQRCGSSVVEGEMRDEE